MTKIEDGGSKIEDSTEAAAAAGRSSILDSRSSIPLWRSADELANTSEFREMLGREFPVAASEWNDPATRRTFLKLMGASVALAGFSGCVKSTTEKIVPYVRQPEEMVPGRPLFFASAATFRGHARGILVESHEGRPTKIEGNPDHPASLGATDAITQGHVLTLYDPDRSQIVNYAGQVSNWNTFSSALIAMLETKKTTGGDGIRLLTGTITSPTLASQIAALMKLYPKIQWHQYEPINTDNEKAGLKQAFGKPVQPVYHFEKAAVIVSLDDNFLTDHPGSVRYARKFADGRRVRGNNRKMNRLYVAESGPTIAGAVADECSRMKPSEIAAVARAIFAGGGDSPFVKKVLADLQNNHGTSLVIAGDGQPPEVHALAAAINSKLGNIGTTVDYIDPVEADAKIQTESITQLVTDMNAGSVDLLIMIGGNPVYDAPNDLKFTEAIQKVRLRVHHSLYYDETSFQCHWHLPLAHELEAWSDARAFDGTATIIQPLIAPLYQGRSAHELLTIMLGAPNRGGYEIVRDYWQSVTTDGDFETQWNKWLNDGVVAGSAAKPASVTLNTGAIPATPAVTGGIEIVFRPDPFLWDGRHANNGWLMELPRPITKLTWDNAALMSLKTAQRLGLTLPGDYNSKPQATIVTLTLGDRKVSGPIWIVPGHPDDVVSVNLGFGRIRSGRVGDNAGFNAYILRTAANAWFAGGLEVADTGETMLLACTQNHAMMNQEGRNLLHVVPINAPEEKPEKRTVSLTLYPPHEYAEDVTKGNKWGMVIDQNACIGCNACVIACQSENNIPVVGKEQVSRGREMQWLRIDHYFAGEDINAAEGPYFQPLPCQHCENAPCEVVCPVAATVHDAEGINNMVYNRCIGTRYCSNNCPYKVRHFNFFQYSNEDVEVLKMVQNPNVTVRSRGVMEKCSYCIQRINATRIDDKKQDRWIGDGEVITACQQACPTQAIFFGNLNDKISNAGKGSVVRQLLLEEANYTLLDELQPQPRTSYLPRYLNRAEKI